MHFSSDDINVSGLLDEQLDISEFCNTPPEVEEPNIVQECATPSPWNVFKGRKLYMRMPTKLASSVLIHLPSLNPVGSM
ncbi:PREDICTED: protein XRI1-like [Nelumbo nucifera]|uniref:Protein XRI1-like n=1 Tax=Nelumbo nucifera TaxID=4432 RepID=A0A1U8A2V7_NELNU|nr:PREDICTED: protein XRI1-like [Nelumbo nucifera]